MKKYIVNILEDNNKTIVTRYLKENFLMKSKFFILLYSIYLTISSKKSPTSISRG